MRLSVLVIVLWAVASVAVAQSTWPPQQDAYDVQAAFRAVMYSAAAYSNTPTQCLNDSFALDSITIFQSTDGDGDTLFGFTGVNHNLNEVVVSFRGTSKPSQLVAEFFSSLTLQPVFDGDDSYLAFSYWVEAIDKLQDQSMQVVSSLLRANPSYKLLVTGHSLGAAMASIFISRMFNFGFVTSKTTVWQYTFGQPRVGTYDYATMHDSLPMTSYRLTHYRDPVVHLPPCHGLLTCTAESGTTYAYHHGLEVFYNQNDMPVSAQAQLCTGDPHNEDNSCSAGYIGASVDDHLYYFNLHVGNFCPNSGAILKRTASFIQDSFNPTLDMHATPAKPPVHRLIVNGEQANVAYQRAARFVGKIVSTSSSSSL